MFIAICVLVSLLAVYLIVDSVKNVIEIFKRSNLNTKEEQLTIVDNLDEK